MATQHKYMFKDITLYDVRVWGKDKDYSQKYELTEEQFKEMMETLHDDKARWMYIPETSSYDAAHYDKKDLSKIITSTKVATIWTKE